MIRRPPRSTHCISSAASDVYKRQLILVAAALVHYQKNEDKICLSVLGRALDKLHDKSGQYCKINVDNVKQKVIEMLDKKIIFTFMF